MTGRRLPTVHDLRALKGRRQLTMLRYFSLDEARAAEIFESKSLVGWKGAKQMVDLAKQSRQVIELLGILEAAEHYSFFPR